MGCQTPVVKIVLTVFAIESPVARYNQSSCRQEPAEELASRLSCRYQGLLEGTSVVHRCPNAGRIAKICLHCQRTHRHH